MSTEQAEFVAAAEQLIEQDKPVDQVSLEPLGSILIGEFKQAELDRRPTEERWLRNLRQYRGQYDPEVLAAIGARRSRAFVRKTRVKVKTVDSRVLDLMFPAGKKKNWNLSPTPKPSLSADQRVEIREMLKNIAQGKPITRKVFDEAVRDWAKTRCQAMSTTIDDQLAETEYKQICTKVIHSGNLYGTGILKGPLVERKVRTRFVKNGGKWVPQSETYVVPFIDYVPLWRFYPDMSATELKSCRYAYERHLMSKQEMADLAARKSFKREKVVAYVLAHPKGRVEGRLVDQELRLIGDRESGLGDVAGKYEVLERWGWIDGTQLRDIGVEVPEDRLHESFFSNIWLLPDGQIIKAVLQPINGVTWPYHIYYFDKDESSIFCEGLASIMCDDQAMINASTRLIIDNAAITSGAQLEVTPSLLTRTENVDEINPWRVWLRNGQNPSQRAVHAIEIPSRVTELSGMVAMFEGNADEVTAIPRYMSGENATNGAAGTSSGLSMLMGNVNIVIKDLLNSLDNGVICSFIKGMYFWNMQFNPDDKIKGDYDVSASGTASLVAKEVRAMSLDRFAQLAADPQDAPYVKRDVLLRQRAEANELVDVVKTEEEVKAEQESEAAKAMQKMQLELQQAALGEAKAKVAKMMADTEVASNKAKEVLANIDLVVAKAVQTRVDAAYAALQAGGTATSSPYIAPAGDEILRSAGWVDKTPEPTIADLNRQPVQPDAGTMSRLSRGQSFVQEPRSTNPGQVVEPRPEPGAPDDPARPPAQTGLVGHHAGIETQRIE